MFLLHPSSVGNIDYTKSARQQSGKRQKVAPDWMLIERFFFLYIEVM